MTFEGISRDVLRLTRLRRLVKRSIVPRGILILISISRDVHSNT